MITDKDCIAKWGEPVNTVKWQSDKFVMWDYTILDSEDHEIFLESCFPKKIYMNKIMFDPFTKAIINLIDANHINSIRTYDGCFTIRRMKMIKNGKISSSWRWSLHSWGIAIDIDATWNGLGREPVISKDIVDCFIKAGFDWGGTWKVPDGMHLQLKSIDEK